MKRKIFICACLAMILCMMCNTFATEYEDLSDLIDDVNQVLSTVDGAPEAPVEEDPIDVTEDYEIPSSDLDDNGNSVPGYEINQTIILSEINAAVQDLAGASLFNVNSSQVQYFETFLCAHPFYDYVITYDGQYDYNLYYGYKLKTATADRIHIYRYNTGSYNYEYRIDFSTGQNVPSSNVYINSMEGQVLHNVQTQKFESVVMLSFAVMLVLWFFSRVIFR